MKFFSSQYAKMWTALIGAGATVAVVIFPQWSQQIQQIAGALGAILTALAVAAIPNSP